MLQRSAIIILSNTYSKDKCIYCFISVEKEINIMMKALVIASSFLVDFNYMDNNVLQIKTKINDMHTREVIFVSCRYKQTDSFAGGGYQMRINPLFSLLTESDY